MHYDFKIMNAYYDYLVYLLAISTLLALVLASINYFKITRKFDRYVTINIPMPIVIEQLARNLVYSAYIVFNMKKYHNYDGLQGEFDFRVNTTPFDRVISVINTVNVFVFIVSLILVVALDPS